MNRFAIYDLISGAIVSEGTSSDSDVSSYDTETHNHLLVDMGLDLSLYVVDVALNTPALTLRSQPAVSPQILASWNDIRDQRDVLRESPIQIDDGRTFEANEASFRLFSDAIDEFDALTTKNDDGTHDWKMTNNNYTTCTRQQLMDIKAELKTKRAVRAGELQLKAEVLNLQGVEKSALYLPSTWGL